MKNSKTLLIGIIAVLLLLAVAPVNAQETIYSTAFDDLSGWSGDISSTKWRADSTNACDGNSSRNRDTNGNQERLERPNIDTRGWQNIEVSYTAHTRNMDATDNLSIYYVVNGARTLIQGITGDNALCTNYQYSLGADASGTSNLSLQFVCKNGNGEDCIVDDLILQGIPQQFVWDSSVTSNNVAAGDNGSIWAELSYTGDHTGVFLNSLGGSGSSFISVDYDSTDIVPNDTIYDGDGPYQVAWYCAPEIMQSPGIYEVIYNINSTQNTTGENITVQCTVDPYVNNEPSVTIDNDSSVNVSTSTPIVYVTVTDDPEQPSAYAEIIANETNVSYSLLQNGVSTAMQFNSLPDGIYGYYARAYDNFSNAVNSENLTILIDTTKPSISASPSIHLNQTVNNNTWTANFTVTDNFYLESVAIEINGTNYAPVQQGNYFTYSANLSLGNHTVNVYANDSLGNEERMLNGWIVYSLPPAPSAISDLPSGGSTKPGLLDSILAQLLQQPQGPTPTAQSPPPTLPAPTAPINPSPTAAPQPPSTTAPSGTAPTGAAVATGTGNGVQGDTVTGFVTLLRNVVTLTAVLLIGAMLGLLLWINSRRQVSF